MFDSPEELLQKIRLCEDTSLELKAVQFRGNLVSEPKRDDLADELAAVANTHDGVLVLGVDDKTHDIIGIPKDRLEVVERYVYEICNESIKPSLLFLSFRMQLPDSAGDLQPVLKVEIRAVSSSTKAQEATSIARKALNGRCHQTILLACFNNVARRD